VSSAGRQRGKQLDPDRSAHWVEHNQVVFNPLVSVVEKILFSNSYHHIFGKDREVGSPERVGDNGLFHNNRLVNTITFSEIAVRERE